MDWLSFSLCGDCLSPVINCVVVVGVIPPYSSDTPPCFVATRPSTFVPGPQRQSLTCHKCCVNWPIWPGTMMQNGGVQEIHVEGCMGVPVCMCVCGGWG